MIGDSQLKAMLSTTPEHFLRFYGNMLADRLGRRPTITEPLLWLLSDDARWVTAAAIPVDAGASEV